MVLKRRPISSSSVWNFCFSGGDVSSAKYPWRRRARRVRRVKNKQTKTEVVEKPKKKFLGKRLKKQFMQRIIQGKKFMPKGPSLHNKLFSCIVCMKNRSRKSFF